ncbi:MAG: hypothetical protein IKG93_02010 [Clostridiales bacterium]|nr:hypothetical protein [Clostridiales bacterium]
MKKLAIAFLILALAVPGGCSASSGTTVAEGLFSETTVATTTAATSEEVKAETEESESDLVIAAGSEETTTSQETEKTEETTTESTYAEHQVIGTETDYTVKFPLKNSTGSTIVEIYVKDCEEEHFAPENLVDAPFLTGDTRDSFFKADEKKKYDIRIVYEDGTEDDIIEFVFDSVTEGELVWKDGKTVLLPNGQEELTPTPTETTKKATKATKATEDPNAGCIGDDGLFY